MQETITIQYQAFNRNPDGSWTTARNADIDAPIGTIRIPRGMTFKAGTTFYSIDVVGLLEQHSHLK